MSKNKEDLQVLNPRGKTETLPRISASPRLQELNNKKIGILKSAPRKPGRQVDSAFEEILASVSLIQFVSGQTWVGAPEIQVREIVD
jgi:hypothetical protein